MGFKFWAQGRLYKDTNKRISSLHGSLFFSADEVEIRRTFATILKILRRTPGSTHCFTYKPTHFFVDFIPFTLGANFPESRITQEYGEYFSF